MYATRSRALKCSLCGKICRNRAELFRHRSREHRLQVGGGDLQDPPFPPNSNPFDHLPDGDEILQLYRDNEVYILQPRVKSDDTLAVFNFPVNGFAVPNEIEQQMEAIYADPNVRHAYKLELSAGVILRNTKTGKLKFFRPHANAYLLNAPLPVYDRRSLEDAKRYLRSLDIDGMIRNLRPSSDYSVVFITNLEWHSWLTDFALGASHKLSPLPNYIKLHRFIATQFDYKGFEKCCLLVCLSQFMHPEKSFMNHRHSVRVLLDRWHNYVGQNAIPRYPRCEPKDFEGLQWEDLPSFEDCFGINVNILQLKPDGTAETKWTSSKQYLNTMSVNLYKDHVHLITNIDKYANKYACPACSRMFRKRWLMDRHKKTCDNRTRYTFPRGVYTYNKSVFEKLEEGGIFVPHDKRFFDKVCVFDMESILQKYHYTTSSGLTTLTGKHIPVSCAMVANCEGFTEPVFLINQSPQILVQDMFDVFKQIREEIVKENLQKWGGYLNELERKLEYRQQEVNSVFELRHKPKMVQAFNEKVEGLGEGQTLSRETLVADCERARRKYLMSDAQFSAWLRLYKEFHHYIHRIVILSYNGQKYDYILILPHLIQCMKSQNVPDADGQLVYENEDETDAIQDTLLDEEANEGLGDGGRSLDPFNLARFIELDKLNLPGETYVIKRGSSYASISNHHFHFMDVTNFLPAGTSYDKFAKAYATQGGQKLVFPYEYLDAFEKLTHPLPPYPSDAWCSELQGGRDMLNLAYEDYLMGPSSKERPKTGQEVYDEMKALYDARGMTTLREWLQLYNEHDVKPFLSGVIRMQETYFDQSLDVWKQAIGIPGISRAMLYNFSRLNHTIFPLIAPEDADLHHLYRCQLAGGPSLIFQRWCKAGVTHISPDNKVLCRSIQGYDANSLYLGTFAAPMPSSMYVRRHESDGFRPRYQKQLYSMFAWLKYMEDLHGVKIRSKMSEGSETRIGNYLIDGFCPPSQLGDNGRCYEYLGCRWHCCKNCTAGKQSPYTEAYAKWEEKKRYLEERGYRVYSVWECEFQQMVSSDDKLSLMVSRMKPRFLKKYPRGVDMNTILSNVLSEDFFGYLLVDIKTPPELKEKFADFPPLFANTNVNLQDLGPIMKEYCISNNITVQNRRMLVSGFDAEEILLSSSLLKFYLQMGLVVTRIYQTISYVPTTCFEGFVQLVTKHRKEAAQDESKRVVGELFKLIGECIIRIVY